MHIYSVEIYIRYKKRFELHDSDIIITDRSYEIVPYQTYRYNKNITFIKKIKKINN